MNTEIEKEFFETFMLAARKERFIWLSSAPSRRNRIFDDLRDIRHFDPRYDVEVTGAAKDPTAITKTLLKLGMKKSVYIISSDINIDGSFQDLETTILKSWLTDELLGFCPQSKIGFFHNHEDWFYILKRK